MHHDSKANDISNPIFSMELSTSNSGASSSGASSSSAANATPTIAEYYQSLTDMDNKHVLYDYASPKDLHTLATDDMFQFLGLPTRELRNKEKRMPYLYVLVKDSSATHNIMKEVCGSIGYDL